MKHLVTLALFLGAIGFYLVGVGPFFFGAPVIGGLLLLCGLALELSAWHRTRCRRGSRATP
jgi:hypothetical protein